MCGHTTLVCAVSNNAVDKAANSVWQKFPEHERQNFKFLRYETTSAEMQSLLTRVDVKKPGTEDWNTHPAYKKQSTVEDDDLVMRTMEDAAQAAQDDNAVLKKLVKTYKSFERGMEEKHKIDSMKKSNVPAAMTLANRCIGLTQEDEYRAYADYDAEENAYKSKKMDAAELERLRQSGEYRTEAELVALGQDPLSDEEFQARKADGRIPSKASRDKSLQYRQSLENYIHQKCKVGRQAKLKFKRLRQELMIWVLQETNCLFSTCNTAGSDILQAGFSPSFVNIDETGKLIIAALVNVLTSLTGWEAVNIYIHEDPESFLPYLISGRANEFKLNAETSVLALPEEKGYEVLRLVLQYRMAPASSQFVSMYFYDGLLQNYPSILVDNAHREKARLISKNHYGIKGDGSEYWMIDIANGVSRVQLNGISL